MADGEDDERISNIDTVRDRYVSTNSTKVRSSFLFVYLFDLKTHYVHLLGFWSCNG